MKASRHGPIRAVSVGLDDVQSSLPTPTTLWFCDEHEHLSIFLPLLGIYKYYPQTSAACSLGALYWKRPAGWIRAPAVAFPAWYCPFHELSKLHLRISWFVCPLFYLKICLKCLLHWNFLSISSLNLILSSLFLCRGCPLPKQSFSSPSVPCGSA